MKILILATFTAALAASTCLAAKAPVCDPTHSSIGIVVMDDGDLVRFKPTDFMEYSKDKGKTWHDVVSDGVWGTMDGRKLTSKAGKFVSLE